MLSEMILSEREIWSLKRLYPHILFMLLHSLAANGLFAHSVQRWPKWNTAQTISKWLMGSEKVDWCKQLSQNKFYWSTLAPACKTAQLELRAKVAPKTDLLLSKPQRNLNRTQDDLNYSWVWCDYDCSHHPTNPPPRNSSTPANVILQSSVN